MPRRSGLQAPTEFRNLLWAEGPGRKLFQRAQSHAVSFAQGAIDGAGFGHAHLGMVENQGRDIAGMGITITNKAPALGRFIDRGFEHPKVLFGVAEGKNGLGHNPPTPLFDGKAQQIAMTDILLMAVLGCGGELPPHREPLERAGLHLATLNSLPPSCSCMGLKAGREARRSFAAGPQ